MKPITEMTAEEAQGLTYVLMDIDDTITRQGKLLAASFAALWKLHEAGLKVIPVTGRPAGWCDLIAREWPVDGVIGENGAFAFWEETNGTGRPNLKVLSHPNAIPNDHATLTSIKERALEAFPDLRVSKDQFARLYDLALDFAEEDPILPLESAEHIKSIAIELGAQAKVSSIHVNIWMGRYDKLSMTEAFLSKRFGWTVGSGDREVFFVGDSPNDEPMFARFPLCAGVANVRRYIAGIKALPAFIASKESGEGFAEIAELILQMRTVRPNND
ncbi:HAD-IIB family hydrolase [Breznakiellaceae bacterium SP9]